MSDSLQELREYLADPIIESECGTFDNFVQNVIDWSDHVNALSLKIRDELKNDPQLAARQEGAHVGYSGHSN